MVKLLFSVSEDPGAEPLSVEAPHDWANDWVLTYLEDFEEVGDGVYAVVMNEGMWAVKYALQVLKKPWPEMEDTIRNSRWAYEYAVDVLDLDGDEADRWADG